MLTEEEILYCKNEAILRVEQQVNDFIFGDTRASFSYGASNLLSARSRELRVEDAYIGCLAEKIASKLAKTSWTKERQQYSVNKSPDLIVNFNGKITKCEVRGSRQGFAIVRPYYTGGKERDFKASNYDKLLIAVSNLPISSQTRVGYKTFRELKLICQAHPEYLRGTHSKSPYYIVPIELFSSNWDIFTNR